MGGMANALGDLVAALVVRALSLGIGKWLGSNPALAMFILALGLGLLGYWLGRRR